MRRLKRTSVPGTIGFLLGLGLLVSAPGSARGATAPREDPVLAEGGGLPSTANEEQSRRIRRILGAVDSADELVAITVDYPLSGSIFPPEITSPAFLWHDAAQRADRWLVEVSFGGEASMAYVLAPGLPYPQGEIDERCISDTNEIHELTPYQASSRSWRPSAAVWEAVKAGSVEREARVTFYGYRNDAPERVLSRGEVTLRTSADPAGAPIFYRDVPLMPAPTEKGVIRPLAQDALPLINWRLKDISRADSRLLLSDMPSCANCHSFAADGETMAMDIDGPQGDKGAYGIAPLEKDTRFTADRVMTWNRFPGKPEGHNTLGFMSQISPDGEYAVATVNEAVHVVNFTDHRFGQVFYPTRGVLAYYSRSTGLVKALSGAEDIRYVHCDPVWSPDGKTLVFARARARDPYTPGQPMAVYAGDPNETQIRYDLYRMPFNEGRGGTPERIVGASDNGMSNTFPKVSPDGKWIVFTQCKNGQLMRPDSRLWIVPFEGGEAREMRCNTSLMNSWHSFSPNGRWMVFSSKSRTPYTQMFLTHIDPDGKDSPPILVENTTAANRAVNIPEFVNTAYEQFLRVSVPAVDHQRHYDRGSELAKAGQLRQARAEFELALEGEWHEWRVNDWTIHERLSSVLLQLGEMDRAMEHIRKSLVLNPANFEMQANLGYLLFQRGAFEEALEHMSIAIRIHPGQPKVWYDRATVRLKLQDSENAVSDYSRAIALDPNFLDAYNGRGVARRAAGDLGGAREDFDAAVRLAPGDPTGWYFRAIVRNDSGDRRGALQDLRQARALAPPDSAQSAQIDLLERRIRDAQPGL